MNDGCAARNVPLMHASVRSAIAGAVFAAWGCAGDGYGLAVAAPASGSLDGGEAGALVEPFDPASVPTRCFVGAHTLVVGPDGGCAELLVSGDGQACGDTSGSPVRVVRRGEVPVRLQVMSTCEGCSLADVESAVFVVESEARAGIGCDGCDAPAAGAHLPIGRFWDVDFALHETDDTVELVLVGRGTELLVRACAAPRSPSQQAFVDACRADCERRRDTCLVDPPAEWLEGCVLRCEGAATEASSDACLDAHREALECVQSLGCVQLGEELRPELEPCEAEVLRWIYC